MVDILGAVQTLPAHSHRGVLAWEIGRFSCSHSVHDGTILNILCCNLGIMKLLTCFLSLSHSLQLASAYVVIASFAMHIFFKPYRKNFQNVIEVVVLLDYTILLLLRSTQTFLDNTSSLRYTGTAVRQSFPTCVVYLGSAWPVARLLPLA